PGIQGWLGTGITDKKMGDHHLPHELSQLYTCEVFTMRINTVTESAGLDVMEIMFPAHPVDMDNFSDFRK
ncbi:hypothetical protein, partial [Escherichia coli]|uniref:hypothetical protein n=1 Tax=Escherichia coli TaxID=562 RepID=UPI001BB0B873